MIRIHVFVVYVCASVPGVRPYTPGVARGHHAPRYCSANIMSQCIGRVKFERILRVYAIR